MNRKNLFFFSISLLLFFLTLGASLFHNRSLKEQLIVFLHQQAAQSKSGFFATLDFHEKSLIHMAELLSIKQSIKSIFEEGVAAALFEGGGPGGPRAEEKRKKLLNAIGPSWNFLQKEAGYRQLHFHYGPEITSFLRVHKTFKFGDNLGDIRPVLKHCYSTGLPASGFETGRIVSGIRGVAPVRSTKTGKVIGTLEAGANFSNVLNSLKNEFHSGYTVLLKKSYMEEKVWPDMLKEIYKKSPLFGNFFPEGTTGPLYRKILNENDLDKLWTMRGNSSEQHIKIIKKDNKKWSVTSFPFKDFIGKKDENRPDIGMIIAYFDATSLCSKYENKARNYTLTAFISYILLVILLYFGTYVKSAIVEQSALGSSLFEIISTYIGSFILGAVIMILISLVQKLHSNIPLEFNSFILPLVFGGFTGVLVHSLTRSLTQKKIELEKNLKQQKEDEKIRMAIEKQIHESRRLESLGVMAGGIAHDFNNLLVGIFGNVQNAKEEFEVFVKKLCSENDKNISDEARKMIESILESFDLIHISSSRASELCSKILSYTGSVHSVHSKIDLSNFINEIMPVIESSISHNTKIELDLYKEPIPILADSQQFIQLVVNLVLNASESYENARGTVIIKTGFEQENGLQNESEGSSWEKKMFPTLEIIDSGCGMSQKVLERVYDPFFTTKFTGRGLGMAAVHGILRIHKASASIESETNKGTCVKIRFPSIEDFNSSKDVKKNFSKPLDKIEAPDKSGVLEKNTLPDKSQENDKTQADTGKDITKKADTILLVDDDILVRKTATKLIKHCGFNVITASNGKEGLALFKENSSKIKAIFLDLTMPEMDGTIALREFRKMDAQINVTIISGFSEHDIDDFMKEDNNIRFLHKPFTLASLKKNLKELE